jgi:hypothetical protein
MQACSQLVEHVQRGRDRRPAGEPPDSVVHAQADHVGNGQAFDSGPEDRVVEARAVTGSGTGPRGC